MRKLGLALSVAVLAAGTVAHAQTAGGISNIGFSAGTTANVSGFDPLHFGPGAGVANGNISPSGVSYNSFVNVGDTAITFESANAGAKNSTTSFSTVSFDVTNNTLKPATFSSTITAAGLGFYLADTSGGCLYTGCAQAVGHTFDELGNGGAQVGFNFSITQTTDSGSTVLYSLAGSLEINRDGGLTLFDDLGGNGICSFDVCPISGPRGLLSNFGDATGNDFTGNIAAASGIGYVWDATDISFGIGSAVNQTLTYTTSVFNNSSQDCIANTSICLVAYSGFGDPVGRGGDVTAFASLANFGAQVESLGPNGLIGGITFGPTTFDIPTFNDGVVTFGSNGVPEPTTWTTLILGFGLLGATLRRRRTVAAI
jgi:hypothetical protein